MAKPTPPCPKCSSTDTKAKRGLVGRMFLGFLAPKSKLICKSCGEHFKR